MIRSYEELFEKKLSWTMDELSAAGITPKEPDSEGGFALNAACKALNLDLVRLLLDMGADVNALSADGFTPLLSVIDRSHLDVGCALNILSVLINSGADIEKRGDFDRTPFLKSCTRGVMEVTKFLVSCGCDCGAKAKDIDGCLGGEDFADRPWNSSEFKEYIRKLCS